VASGSVAWIPATCCGVFNEQARTSSGMLGVSRGVQDADGIGERGVPDFYLLMSSSGARVLWVVRLPWHLLWGVLRFPLDSASLAYASSSFHFSLALHSLTRSHVRSRIRAIFPLSPRRFFHFFPCSQHFRAHTIPRLVPYCPPRPLVRSFPPGGVRWRPYTPLPPINCACLRGG
jgi:hypothetical protein